jgi:hypothetical protein
MVRWSVVGGCWSVSARAGERLVIFVEYEHSELYVTYRRLLSCCVFVTIVEEEEVVGNECCSTMDQGFGLEAYYSVYLILRVTTLD